ncbi:MAG: argininosuccinate lyase [Acidobacteria bacterium]|nr:argininosuccinate lyase [Acidobacteriota bacterium]
MRRLILVIATITLFLFGFARNGDAGEQDFTLANETGDDIDSLYLSPTEAYDWGDDVLGKEFLGDGHSIEISFSHGEHECLWDFMVKDDEGNSVEWDSIDLCQYSTITLHKDEDKVWATFE